MPGELFQLKFGNTFPILKPVLVNPDGTVHDLTGADSVTLYIRLSDGTKLSRAMIFPADRLTGAPEYEWEPADWTDPTAPLVVGTHRMEYKVLRGTDPLTFPNNTTDVLEIAANLEP